MDSSMRVDRRMRDPTSRRRKNDIKYGLSTETSGFQPEGPESGVGVLDPESGEQAAGTTPGGGTSYKSGIMVSPAAAAI